MATKDPANLVTQDDDDDASLSYETTQDFTPEERDEKQAVYKMSAKDTFRVQLWRVAVTVVLLLTAVAVTLTTYKFLKDEEQSNFEVAFEQFSRTVGDAAISQQEDLREALITLTHHVSAHAKSSNQTWPFVTIPMWEMYAEDAAQHGNGELMSLCARVFHDDQEEYIDFTDERHIRETEEGHMIRYGNLDKLNRNESLAKSYISGLGFVPDKERDEYWPVTYTSPPAATHGFINWNPNSVPGIEMAGNAMLKLQYETSFSMVMPYKSGEAALTKEVHQQMHSKLKDSTTEHPHTFALHPVHEDPLDDNSKIVARVGMAVALDAALLALLPTGVEGIICVIKNTKNQTYTYEIIGHDAIYQGEGDLHEAKYDKYEKVVNLGLHTNPIFETVEENCRYRMHIYPSSKFQGAYDSNTPEVFAGVVAVTFVVVAIVFFVYDLFVQRRNENLVAKAAQTNAIVSSLFPDNIRERLMHEKEVDQNAKSNQNKKGNLKAYLNHGKGAEVDAHKPMADLFLDTTVLFADICGFTAWSSVREPTQVFILLETLYQAFDQIAKRRRVFKVETVGDCYVAVCGLPEPRLDHSIVMARFARDILARIHVLTKDLEVTLGPDTADLGLRIGMHSGPVTAGVLRGERARFQLFGDTMNTCARLESTGKRGRIHISKETAAHLKNAGKEGWLEKRDDLISVKGKGSMETYFLNVEGVRAGSVASRSSVDEVTLTTKKYYGKPMPGLCERTHRLIDWNVEMLLQILKEIVARRAVKERQSTTKPSLSSVVTRGVNPLDEVKEIIALPEFDSKATSSQQDPAKVQIPKEVVENLHLLVSEIASMYNNNPFHNFDHASHVVMSVTKLMSRIVAPDLDDLDSDKAAASLHDHTYGITSDPLTQFACAFSALIHDVDHVGVSNAQLVKEELAIAAQYKNRSVAEQNSLDLSWDLLMEPRFDVFRNFLFTTQSELVRFRELVVNSVMSTDIVDKDLKALRNARWDKAFKKGVDAAEENPRDAVNRKATIVIEHIIQASDISHTMQHWHVYRKWNQNLFEELYVAYLNGRMEKSPVEFWWKGEFGFFDFYIIPLTQKLKDCGVFGVSSDEYLNYAKKNREEWEEKGEEVVAEMIVECERKYGTKDNVKAQCGLLLPGKQVSC